LKVEDQDKPKMDKTKKTRFMKNREKKKFKKQIRRIPEFKVWREKKKKKKCCNNLRKGRKTKFFL